MIGTSAMKELKLIISVNNRRINILFFKIFCNQSAKPTNLLPFTFSLRVHIIQYLADYSCHNRMCASMAWILTSLEPEHGEAMPFTFYRKFLAKSGYYIYSFHLSTIFGGWNPFQVLSKRTIAPISIRCIVENLSPSRAK